VVDDYERFARAARREPVLAPRDGVVEAIDAESIGRASMMLGAGRERLDTPIDYGAGILLEAPVGARIKAGDVLAWLCVGATARLEEARALAAAAFVVGAADASPPPLVIDVVS
jgi:pyrimidine-nucleoside phosphorylase